MAKLGECFSVIRNGASIRQTDGAGGFPITRIETIADKTINREKFGYAGIYDLAQYRGYILQDGDILMSHINSEKHLGKVALYSKQDDEQIIHGMNLLMLRADTQKVIPEYAKYYFESQKFLRQIGRITKKSVNQASFTVTALKELEIPLASIIVQRDISEKLKKVDWLASLRKQQIAKLDELVKVRFVEMFGNPASNTMGWKSEQLVDCLQGIDNGKSFVCSNDTRQGQEPAMLKLSAVTYGVYNQKENKVLLDDTMFIKAAEVHRGDLLFTRKNTPELVGMCAYVTNTEPNLMMPDLIFRLNPNDKINAIFLWKLINHELFREKIQNIATGSAKSMSNISKERLGKLKIIVPPIPLQNQFATFMERVDQQKQTVQQSLEKLELMKKALMQEYFG